MQANFPQIFERVSNSLPFCYGKLALNQTSENHKLKNKKKSLMKVMKTYTWDSYKPLSFHEWRDSNGYTDEWCKSEGIGINSLFNTKTKLVAALPCEHSNKEATLTQCNFNYTDTMIASAASDGELIVYSLEISSDQM